MISSLTPVTTAVPLIGVLSLTAVKDAYDDIVSPINESVFQPFCVTGPFGTKKIGGALTWLKITIYGTLKAAKLIFGRTPVYNHCSM